MFYTFPESNGRNVGFLDKMSYGELLVLVFYTDLILDIWLKIQ